MQHAVWLVHIVAGIEHAVADLQLAAQDERVGAAQVLVGRKSPFTDYHVSQPCRRQYLDPIPIRIPDECQPLHVAVIRTFDLLDSERIEAFASRVDVRYGYADVAEAAWLRVAVVVCERTV